MKQNNKLNYSRKSAENRKNLKSFIISFAAFVLVLGAVSFVMFMKSINFDFKNIVSSDELSTQAQQEESTQALPITGGLNIVVLCNNSDGDLSFSFLIKSNYETMTAEVAYIPVTLSASYNGVTSSLNSHFKKGGAQSCVNAFKEYSGIDVDRYILVNETQFKDFMAKFSDVTVRVPRKIDSNAAEGLNLNKGDQNLTSDLLLKYIKYIENAEKSKAFANMLSVVFEKKNTQSLEKLFTYLVNNSQTDISIIDFTAQKENIEAFMQAEGKFIATGTLGEVMEAD